MNRSTDRWVSGDRKGRSSPASNGTLDTRLLVEPSGTEPAPTRQRAVGLA